LAGDGLAFGSTHCTGAFCTKLKRYTYRPCEPNEFAFVNIMKEGREKPTHYFSSCKIYFS
jgi:hypothetical protein